MEREADVSGILSQTVDVVGGAGRAVAIYTLVLGMIMGIGALFGLASINEAGLTRYLGRNPLDSETLGLARSVFDLVYFVTFLFGTYALLRQMMIGLGRRPAAGTRFWSFLGMSILAFLGTMFGFMLLIIPGFIVMVRWAAANGFVLTGDYSVSGSLGASWEATSGRGGSIFLAGLLLTIGLAVLSGILTGILMGAGIQQITNASPFVVAVTAASGFVNAFTTAVNFAFSMAVFHLVAPADTSVADVFE